MLCLLTASPPQSPCLSASDWRSTEMPAHARSVRSRELCCCCRFYRRRPPPPPAMALRRTFSLESFICNVPCLLFIRLLCIPCITAAEGVPRSRITPPSQTVFLSRVAIDTSVPGSITMAAPSERLS